MSDIRMHWPPHKRSPRSAQPVIRWPNEARIAFWVAPNIEFYEIAPPGNRVRMPWPRPLPDIQNHSWRDYGNRVGVWRCLDVFDRLEIQGSVSLNSAMCTHLPVLVEEFVKRGWELFSHGIYNTRYHFGLSPDDELSAILESCNEIETFSGQKVRGFLAPALTYTESTFANLARAGLLYTLDLFNEDHPAPLDQLYGSMVSIPYQLELNDFHALVQAGMAAETYVQKFKDHFDQLYEEGLHSGKVVGLPLHPYVIGLPNYIWALEEMLSYVRQHDKVWMTTSGAIAEHYVNHHLAAASQTSTAGSIR